VEPFASIPCPTEQAADSILQITELLKNAAPDQSDLFRTFIETIQQMEDSERLCDVLTYHLVQDDKVLRRVLREPEVATRFEMLLTELTLKYSS
jgi:ATP-dependent Lon protease